MIQKTALAYLDVVISNTDLIGAEVELIEEKDREKKLDQLVKEVEASTILFSSTAPLSRAADHQLIDGSPFRDHSSSVRILCLGRLGQLLKTIRLIKQSLNPKLEIEGILLTMFDGRNNSLTKSPKK